MHILLYLQGAPSILFLFGPLLGAMAWRLLWHSHIPAVRQMEFWAMYKPPGLAWAGASTLPRLPAKLPTADAALAVADRMGTKMNSCCYSTARATNSSRAR